MSNKQIRVLHALGSLNVGGIETWLINILRQNCEQIRFDFILDVQNGEYESEAREHGSQIYHNPPISRLQRARGAVGLYNRTRTLERVLAETHYDAVHVHGDEFFGHAMKAAAKMRVPVRIAHCHNTNLARGTKGSEIYLRYLRLKTLERFLIKKYATDIFACSNMAGRFLMGDQWDTNAKCRALYCGIPLDPYRNASKQTTRSQYREAKGIPEDAIVVGHIGSMGSGPQKNHEFLIDVFCELAKRDDRYHLFLAGHGPSYLDIQRFFENRGLRERVFMPGICDDVPELVVHGFDVLVFPSLLEGLGLVIVEAMAGGLYTVCSDVIPPEVSVDLSARIKALSLSAPVSVWADEVEKAVKKRITVDEGIAIVKDSPFSIHLSLRGLLAAYQPSENPIE